MEVLQAIEQYGTLGVAVIIFFQVSNIQARLTLLENMFNEKKNECHRQITKLQQLERDFYND